MITAPRSSHSEPRPEWEIFCKVVDNFGDIGVCWRLARGLAADHGIDVRLWVDDIGVFRRLCPQAQSRGEGLFAQGVTVLPWRTPFSPIEPAAVVIEAFACELPPTHVEAMARRENKPVWINLEYLSAEDWVAGCHAMASPHPLLPLTKHFFFPGFDDASGGLLRESGLLGERDRFRAGDGPRRWLAEHGAAPANAAAVLVSVFAYEQPALGELVASWAGGVQPVLLLVPEGRVLGDVARAFGRTDLVVGDRLRQGAVELVVLPFMPQRDYDRLLWTCDLNFVRGEDSFVRAQWAGRPFVWQIYPQQDGAHQAKLDAFLARYCAGLDAPLSEGLRSCWQAWNGPRTGPGDWAAMLPLLPAIGRHAQGWCESLARQTDLATTLTQFCNHSRGARE